MESFRRGLWFFISTPGMDLSSLLCFLYQTSTNALTRTSKALGVTATPTAPTPRAPSSASAALDTPAMENAAPVSDRGLIWRWGRICGGVRVRKDMGRKGEVFFC